MALSSVLWSLDSVTLCSRLVWSWFKGSLNGRVSVSAVLRPQSSVELEVCGAGFRDCSSV